MGSSAPKAIKQEAAPPPATTSSAEVGWTEQQTRKKANAAHGSRSTINTGRGTLLQPRNPVMSTPRPQRNSLLTLAPTA